MAVLLVTDLDGTILGDQHESQQFVQWHRCHADDVQIVYASGRFCQSMANDIMNHHLPEPIALIGGVGSEIQLRGEATLSIEWAREISHCWNPTEVQRLLDGVDGLVPQPDEFQSLFKLSYFLPDATSEKLDAIRRAIETPWLRVEMIYSSNRDLDLLPAGVNKGSAAAFVINVSKMEFDHILVAGDSGNDRSLFELGYPGVVVANAQEDLRRLIGQHVYHARRAFAAGVVEGVDYWLQKLRTTEATKGIASTALSTSTSTMCPDPTSPRAPPTLGHCGSTAYS